MKWLTVDKPEYFNLKSDDVLFQATEGYTNLVCAKEPFSLQKEMLLLIFLPAGTSTDVWMALDLAITVAEQIRCSHSSQDHIIHSTGNHCHSLNHVPSLSVSLAPSLPLSLTHTLAPRPLIQNADH